MRISSRLDEKRYQVLHKVTAKLPTNEKRTAEEAGEEQCCEKTFFALLVKLPSVISSNHEKGLGAANAVRMRMLSGVAMV